MAINPIEALETRELTRLVNREKKPRRALSAMLFPQVTHRNLLTEAAQIDELTGSQEMAPFVTVNGEAVAVGQGNGNSYTVETPNISVKRPLTAQRLLLERQAGSPVVFSNGRDMIGENITMQIAKDTARLETTINNREEWLVAQSLTGIISYTNEDTGAVITVDLRKPDGNEFVAPNGIWTAGAPKVRLDIKDIKRLANDNEVAAPTDAIGDATAADALYALIDSEVVKLDKDAGMYNPSTSMVNSYEDNGMSFIGVIGGVRFWEYNASYTDQGVTATFIRPGYFEFVPLTQTAQMDREMLFGRILDIEAWKNNADITERYSFVITKKEPSVMIQHLKSRPLPWWYRADQIISMKVTA